MARAPFIRTWQEGDKDACVVEYKRTVSHAHPLLYPWRKNFTPYYGEHFADVIEIVRRKRGLTKGRSISINVHNSLMEARNHNYPAKYAADGKTIAVLKARHTILFVSPLEAKVDLGLQYARLLVANNLLIKYLQSRPMLLYKAPGFARSGDCSDSITKIFYAAGLPDPNGRDFDGQGYTGTLVGQGRFVPLKDIQPLDMLFYGYTIVATPAFPVGAPTHVAMSMGDFPLDRTFSFGSEPGPEWNTIVTYRPPRYARRYIPDL